jgi:hypothetical protein
MGSWLSKDRLDEYIVEWLSSTKMGCYVKLDEWLSSKDGWLSKVR